MKDKLLAMEEIIQLQDFIEEAIGRQISAWEQATPANLYQPVIYSLRAGGKRLRPLMVLLGYRLFGDKPETVMPAALAVEIFHNFTLLHDDIMDKADLRRNRPTVHRQFGQNSAILSGDVMAFLAYQFLLRCPSERKAEILGLFSRTAVEVCEGQQMDMDFEERLEVTPGEYLTMIRLKTAVLLACALQTGALAGACREREAALLYEAGINLGMAFQLRDDLLDSFGDETTFGKKIGGDILANKKTYLLVEALQTNDPGLKGELLHWLAPRDGNDTLKINAVKAIFEKLNLRGKTEAAIRSYHDAALETLGQLDANPGRKKWLADYFSGLISRTK